MPEARGRRVGRRAAIAAATFGVALAASVGAHAQTPFTFAASDGTVIHAERYGAGRTRGLVLAFHQARSNKSEYAPIAPRSSPTGSR